MEYVTSKQDRVHAILYTILIIERSVGVVGRVVTAPTYQPGLHHIMLRAYRLR